MLLHPRKAAYCALPRSEVRFYWAPMNSRKLLTVVTLGAAPSLCFASDTYSSSQWGLLAFFSSLVFILPVYAFSLAIFIPLARNGSSGHGWLAHAVPLVVVCTGILLAGKDLLGMPLAGAWLLAWALYGLLLKRFGSRCGT